MKPEFDTALFALAISIKLAGRSYASACMAHPYLNKAMLSRAVSRQVLSAVSVLALCRAFELDPQTYLTVTPFVSRETGDA